MTKDIPLTEAETTGPMTAAQPAAALPSEHIVHASVYHQETVIRLSGFEAGIAAIKTEIEGQQISFEERVVALQRDHESSKAALLHRQDDLERGRRMALAALDEFDRQAPSAAAAEGEEQDV